MEAIPVVETPPVEPVVVVEPVVTAVPEPIPEVIPPSPPASDVFQVSEEKYTTSLKEIRDLVDRLNATISSKDIEEWKNHLDSTYLKKYSDAVFLKAVSNDSAVLKQYSIRLKTLKDYFEWVVVPSRSKVMVDEIRFVDEERVEAYTLIKNQKILLYQLKLYGKEWKISFW